MLRREKGFKRYASQRERRFTEPLIREDEIEQVRQARQRMSTHTLASAYNIREKQNETN